MERELFIRLAMCMDPRRGEAAGLSARAVRSMGIGAEGIGLRERLHRRALKLKILGSMWRYKPGTETLPGFGPHPGFPEHEQMAVSIPAKLLEQVARKIVRGCEYRLAEQRLVEAPYQVRVYFVHQGDVPANVVQAFQSRGARTTHLGPGFRVTRVPAHDEPGSVMYEIVVWGTLVIYGAILPEEAQPGEHGGERD